MSKKTKLTPELRFPEFVDEGEWEEKILGKLAKKIVKKNKDGLINNVFTNSAIDGIVDQRDYFDKDIANKNNLENYYIVEDGDYVYNPRISNIAPVGPISKNKTKKRGVLSPLYTVFRFTNKNNDFYEYYFKTIHWYSAIRKASNTGARFDRMSITDSVFMNIPILYPLPSEQQKIASCLSSLDEMIAAQGQKLDLLKDHKKGLMQKLFPQEGEKVPKYRFKEFEKDGEWVEKPIDKIKTILTDYVANGSFQSLRKNLNVLDSEDYAFYVRLTDLRAGLGHSNQKYVDKNTYLFLNKSSLFGGELLMANIGANVGEVWQMPFIEKPATLAPNMIMIKFKSDIDNQFIYQYLTSDIGVANISSVISGSGHPKINKTDLRQVKVFMPPKLEEQQKIASCLSFLDALITSKTEKIKQLKLHKKGLMQRLFPKIND
ncbi:restriction endonuclease subunit S [Apibacter sp. B3706]|uniref:restriction endonuclease subunit S n=1 Tax=Apibacter sp. B3706 TaxID=2656760 RepID=UPI00140C574C|nr:restriction endonuclease subunit S [Apibacter sp. B3706]QII69941.1 restriction endonuclease subunit S [Apibacter sp. B3706]